jgi:hypothetical protein
MAMPTVNTHERSPQVAGQSSAQGCRASKVVRFGRVFLLVIGACSCFGLNLFAQTFESQTAAKPNNSWTVTTDSKSNNLIPERAPVRIIESHSQSGNRTWDKRSVEIRGTDGHFEPYQDVERETLQVDATTVRTTTRTFGQNANGMKALVQVTEEEKHILPGGDSNVTRVTSNPDVNGRPQPVQHETVETKKIGKDLEEANTTVMLPAPTAV